LVGIAKTDAVVFAVNQGVIPQEALAWARSATAAPIILFESNKQHYDGSHFNLVIPVFTDPQVWLSAIAELIGRSAQHLS
jgi:hypothetical protein